MNTNYSAKPFGERHVLQATLQEMEPVSQTHASWNRAGATQEQAQLLMNLRRIKWQKQSTAEAQKMTHKSIAG